MKISIKSRWPAVIWIVLSTIAFCLPGSALPKNDWLGEIYFDKWIHIGIFTIMIILWCLPLLHKQIQLAPKLFVLVAIIFLGYGVSIEFIQHFLIANRSFDLGDIAADAVGCLVGYFFVRYQWKQ